MGAPRSRSVMRFEVLLARVSCLTGDAALKSTEKGNEDHNKNGEDEQVDGIDRRENGSRKPWRLSRGTERPSVPRSKGGSAAYAAVMVRSLLPRKSRRAELARPSWS